MLCNLLLFGSTVPVCTSHSIQPAHAALIKCERMPYACAAALQFPIRMGGPDAANVGAIAFNYRHVMSWGANIPEGANPLHDNLGERLFFVGPTYNLYAVSDNQVAPLASYFFVTGIIPLASCHSCICSGSDGHERASGWCSGTADEVQHGPLVRHMHMGGGSLLV
jgi:hypothetical protein